MPQASAARRLSPESKRSSKVSKVRRLPQQRTQSPPASAREDEASDNEGDVAELQCPACSCMFEAPPRENASKEDLAFSHIPKLLPECLHTVCQNCCDERLQRSQRADTLVCPVCDKLSMCSSHTNSLTNDYARVAAVREFKARSQHELECDECHDIEPASHRCTDCDAVLCSYHVEHHARTLGTARHVVRTISDLAAAAAAAHTHQRRRVPCLLHPGMVAKLYCPVERCLICHDCGLDQHHGHSFTAAEVSFRSQTVVIVASFKIMCAHSVSPMCFRCPRLQSQEAASRQRLSEEVRRTFSKRMLPSHSWTHLTLHSATAHIDVVRLLEQRLPGNG
jgi:hypothetical protein